MGLKPLVNEQELICAISKGDEKAFEKLFYSYSQPLYSFIISILKCSSTSEEVLNDVFLKIWQQRQKLSSVNSLSDYIFIICRNYSLNALRQLASKKKETVTIEKITDTDLLEHENDLENPKIELLKNAIKKLPTQQQKVILLKHNGYKNDEVASQMQLSTNSVKKYQKLAIDNLTKVLNFNP